MRNSIFLRIRLDADFQHRFARFDLRQTFLDALLNRMTGKVFANPRGNRTRDLGRVQFIGSRQQPVTMTGAVGIAPFAGVVEFANDTRTHIVAPVVELFFELIFEYLTFFFDHQNFFQAFGKTTHALRFERPGHADFVEPQTDVARDDFIDPEVFEGLTGIEIGFACSENAETRLGTIPDQTIELVGARIGQRRIPFVIDQPRFLFKDAIWPANIETAGRQLEIFRQRDLHALRIDIHRGTGFNHISDAFHRHPQAGVATHRPAMQTVIQIFLHRRRVQHRDATGLEDVFALVRVG